MVKTYILAPNWTTHPDGPVRLGHLLAKLTEFKPVNQSEVVDIPSTHLNEVDIKSGFRTSRSKLVSGELGFFGRVMGLIGVGMGPGIYLNKEEDDVLCCEALETRTFDPTAEYVASSMDLQDVRDFMEGCRRRAPVYMITGLKIGRGASLQSSRSRSQGVGMRLYGGLDAAGSSAHAGGFVRRDAEEESWAGSTDFIVAFRVRKIWYKRNQVRNEEYTTNAVMQDGSAVRRVPDLTLQADDDIHLSDLESSGLELMTESDVEGGEVVNWIIPQTVVQN